MEGFGLRPNEIDELTLPQILLYYPDEPEQVLSLEEAELKQLAIYRKSLAQRLEEAGRDVPQNLEQLPKEELDALWRSVEGVLQ
jgi:hypothetical protein